MVIALFSTTLCFVFQSVKSQLTSMAVDVTMTWAGLIHLVIFAEVFSMNCEEPGNFGRENATDRLAHSVDFDAAIRRVNIRKKRGQPPKKCKKRFLDCFWYW